MWLCAGASQLQGGARARVGAGGQQRGGGGGGGGQVNTTIDVIQYGLNWWNK